MLDMLIVNFQLNPLLSERAKYATMRPSHYWGAIVADPKDHDLFNDEQRFLATFQQGINRAAAAQEAENDSLGKPTPVANPDGKTVGFRFRGQTLTNP
jgi:hypothetical protein